MTAAVWLLVALSILLSPLAADAQQPAKIPRIGVLASIRSPATEGFERGLREFGYVEGKNILVEWRLVQGKFERLPEFAADLVRLKVDVIVAPASIYVRAAREATKTIPIVFALVPDPVAMGFVKSLARPSGNITGLSSIAVERVIGETGGVHGITNPGGLHGFRLVPSGEVEPFFWAVARGEKAIDEIAAWLKAHAEPWREP
ncbi:MAG: hypothetical protein HYY64_12855 [Candidatus Rokubacteria bacterium]|nr:hypothetical protein [Candidatus Rokubacteria bacterium]